MPRTHSLNWINRPIHRDELDAKFIEKHETSLGSVARSIKQLELEYSESNGPKEPGGHSEDFYVLSLTRTGPRIIELMELGDIKYDDAAFVSEKSLDFMPSKSFKGANVALFDDIAVTGQTISRMCSHLEMEYEMNVYPHLLAIDDERLSIDRDPLNYQLELSPGKRFQFIHEMVNAFTFLNKPYDVDHAIFYSEIGPNNREVFESLDDCYDLTTPYQAEHGFRRYAIIPGKLDRTFLDSHVFNQGVGDTQIEKLRIYYDEETGAVRYVPVSIFSLHKRLARSQALFSPSYDQYNELLSMGHNYLDTNSPSMAMFRVIWYLRSVITGQQYFREYLTDIDDSLCGSPLGEALNHRDLSILFGPEFGWKLRSSLYESQISSNESSSTPFGPPHDEVQEGVSSQSPVSFDESQNVVVEEISDYVNTNLNHQASISEQLATVFEAFHVEVERDAIGRYGGQTEGKSRRERDVGLSYPQIRSLLEDSGANLNNTGAEIGLSLSFDFLIDSGVQVPMFYERDHILERAYRHGEGVLNNTRYAYLVDSVAEAVFEEVRAIDNSRLFSKVAFEKIGFLIGDKLDNNKYWAQTATDLLSLLREPISKEAMTNRIRVGPGVHRHGRIQEIEMLGEMGTERLFNQWATEEGIVDENKKGVQKSSEWKNTSKIDRNIVPDEMLNDFEAIGICCSHINKELGNDPLIAITTCRTEGEFVNAARKEIELVFENPQYSLPKSISNLSGVVEDHDKLLESGLIDLESSSLINTFDEIINQARAAKSAISDIQQKHGYWKNLNEYIEDIDNMFDTSGRHLQLIYKSGLKTYLENLSQQRADGTDRSDHIRKKTLYTARVIKRLSNFIINLALAAKSILSQRNIRPTLATFFNSITEWNHLIEETAPGSGNLEFAQLSKLDLSSTNVTPLRERSTNPDRYQDTVVALRIVNELLDPVMSQLEAIEAVYEHTYKVDEWKERYEKFYPESNSSVIEDIETTWALWYDMKDSTAPDNEAAASRLKSHLNNRFSEIKAETDDGYFQTGMDDSKHIFTSSREGLLRYLQALLEASDDLGIVERVGVCKTRPNEVRRNVETGKFNSDLAHRLSNRLGEFPRAVADYEEPAGEHTLTLSEDVLADVFDRDLPSTLTDWKVSKRAEQITSFNGVNRRIKVHAFHIDSPTTTNE